MMTMKNKSHYWEVEMYKNVGTEKLPNFKWVKEIRIYSGEKSKSDFDLHDVKGKRKNANFLYAK